MKSINVLPLTQNKSASKDKNVFRLEQDYVVIKEVYLSPRIDERCARNHHTHSQYSKQN